MERVISTDNDDDLNKRRIQKLIGGYCRLDDDSINVHTEIVDMCYLYFTYIFSKHVFHCDLFEACSKEDLKVVRQILTIDSNTNVIAHGVDENADESSPCYFGCGAVAEVLLETIKQGINEQNYGTNTLQMAAQAGYNKIVKLLLYAISKRQPKVVKCLMDHNTEGDLCFYEETKFYSPLIEACRRGFVEIVELLVQSSNININHHKETNYDNATALYVACECGATQCVRHLISNHSVFINEATTTGRTPLLAASFQGHDEIIEMLIDHSNRMSAQGINHGTLDVNQCDIEGFTPLLAAAQNGHTKIVTILLHNEADVNAANKEGVTPLMVSSQQGHIDVVRVLLSHPSIDIDHQAMEFEGMTALMGACFANQFDVVEMLLNPQNQKLATDDEKKQIKSRKGANPNVSRLDGKSPLWVAASQGNSRCVKLLINYGADVNKAATEKGVEDEGTTPLYVACQIGKKACVDLLLSTNLVFINEGLLNGRSPLLIACGLDHDEIVEMLIDHSNRMSVQGIKHGTLDVNQCDIEGLTPLLAAAREGHTKIVTILLRNEADVNACGKEGVTSLMVSSQQGHVDVVRVLLSHPSIDIDHQDVQGTTALMAACFTNQLEVVEVLLNPPNQIFATDNEKKQTKSRKGANPNLTMHAPCEGVSALHFAAAEGNAEIVKMIYEHLLTVKTITSEDIVDFVNAAGTEGYTPLHCGSREGSEDVVKYLVNVVKVDIFKKNDDNMNALDIASSLGHNAVVTWLSNLYSDDAC